MTIGTSEWETTGSRRTEESTSAESSGSDSIAPLQSLQ